ncbi:MAG: hypothetical protein NT033_02840 [Candidatus Omnitrophica bacterium]|nr:hypothetical protein [Candidatus Omnitrophota bacterium]
MRLSKFLILVFFFTLVSLLYVFQQTEIIRLAYLEQKRQTVFQVLLDKNTVLQYNIKKSASLIRIGSRISRDGDFQMPNSYQFVRLKRSEQQPRIITRLFNRPNVFSRIFAVKREAEAYTINP